MNIILFPVVYSLICLGCKIILYKRFTEEKARSADTNTVSSFSAKRLQMYEKFNDYKYRRFSLFRFKVEHDVKVVGVSGNSLHEAYGAMSNTTRGTGRF